MGQSAVAPIDPGDFEDPADLIFELMRVIGAVQEGRADPHGMPLGCAVVCEPIIGNSRDPAIARHLDHNEADLDHCGGIVVTNAPEDDPSVLRHTEHVPPGAVPPSESFCDVRTFRPRWRSDGRRVQLELALSENGGYAVTTREVPSEVSQRLSALLETTRMRHQATLAQTERVARGKLEEHLTEYQRDCYEVDGSFYEYSHRSGITYLLRKSRPTIALRVDREEKPVRVRPLCALCLHFFAYYQGTWASVLAPSDEILGTLFMIRRDEPGLWKAAGQHPLDSPLSGV